MGSKKEWFDQPKAATLGEGAEKLLRLVERLSGDDSEWGAIMLLTAAAGLAPDLKTFLDTAEKAYHVTRDKEDMN